MSTRPSFAGYTDWRMPKVKELESIVDYGRAYYLCCVTKIVFPSLIQEPCYEQW